MARVLLKRYRCGFFVAIAAAAALTGACQPALAQQPPLRRPLAGMTLRMATRVVPPFVIKKDGALTGFSIDLGAALAEAVGVKLETDELQTLPELLDAVRLQKSDIGLAAISITAKREEEFDFSQPMFDSGLQILTRSSGGSSGLSFAAIRRMIASGPVLDLVTFLAALILLIAHVVWFFDRKHPDGGRRYYPGIFKAIYWATGASGGQQPYAPHSALARVIGALTVFTSIIVVAYFTAAVTSSMTVDQLKSDINGPDDLPGKKIGTVVGSTSAAYLAQAKLKGTEFGKIADAFDALIAKDVDAVVYDAPVLLYFAATDGKDKTAMAGPVFRREAYGIVFPQGSPFLKPINAALLKLRESGGYDAIYRKWFGAAPGGG